MNTTLHMYFNILYAFKVKAGNIARGCRGSGGRTTYAILDYVGIWFVNI